MHGWRVACAFERRAIYAAQKDQQRLGDTSALYSLSESAETTEGHSLPASPPGVCVPFIWPVHSRVIRGRPGGRGISAIPACTPVTASPHAAAFGPTSLQHSLRHVYLRFTRACACGMPSGKPRSRSLLSSCVRALTSTQRPAHPTVQLRCVCCCPHVPVRLHRLVPSSPTLLSPPTPVAQRPRGRTRRRRGAGFCHDSAAIPPPFHHDAAQCHRSGDVISAPLLYGNLMSAVSAARAPFSNGRMSTLLD